MKTSIDDQIKALEEKKKKLLKKKVQDNREVFYKMGQLLEGYFANDFADFSLEKFKAEVKLIKGIVTEKTAVVVVPAVNPQPVSLV